MNQNTFLWNNCLKGKNVLLYEEKQNQEELSSGTEEYQACYISEKVTLDDSILDYIYKKLPENGDVYLIRKGNKINFQREGLQLIKKGFDRIVQMKEKEYRGSYILHCKKGRREQQLLSIIVPVFNEENTVGDLLTKLVNKQLPNCEIIIVESNSSDQTRTIVQSFASYPNVRIIFEEKPSGKGNAVLHGIKEAKGQYIAIQDGDLEYDINDYDKLLPPLLKQDTFFVLGSRYQKDDWKMRKFSGKGRWIADYLNIGQTLLTWVINTACGCKLSDPFTMYKIFHKDCLYGINFLGGNFGLDWELVIRFIRKGYLPTEIPISYKARSYAEGKHIELFKTPIEGLKALIRCRFIANVYDYGDD